MKERLAIIGGVRTPFCKANGVLKNLQADDLGAFAVKELVLRTGVRSTDVDELIFGNVIQPPQSANLSRILAIKAQLPIPCPAYTVNRNCASGMEAITTAANKILSDEADIIIAGGTESMSNVPILFGPKMVGLLMKLNKAKTIGSQLKAMSAFRPAFLAPVIPGLVDPLCGLTMGKTAELLARDFTITRQEQDEFSLMSHQRAAAAIEGGKFQEEIVAIPVPPKYEAMQNLDDGVRSDTSIENLAKLRPAFEKVTGTVTPGNASQITDGAAAILLMRESKAKSLGLQPIGYLSNYAYAALQPNRMGMGPVFATAKLLEKTGGSLKDFDLIEMNEAFAAQVIANERAFASEAYAKANLNRDSAIGEIDREKLNVNGGAIALGHPVGATGTRLIMTLLRELKERNLNRGLATLCVGGGQGAALQVEVN